MSKILILFSHPVLEKSVTQITLVEKIKNIPGVTFHDLYQLYPEFDIDIEREKQLMLEHDIIIWQHPLYWYSCPALLKQWIDLVLEHGWAYGKEGIFLKDKWIFNAISAGGPLFGYVEGGFNRFTLRQFLAPFDQTATLCRMEYLPPFVIHGTHRATADDRNNYSYQYRQILIDLTNNKYDLQKIKSVNYLNDLIP